MKVSSLHFMNRRAGLAGILIVGFLIAGALIILSSYEYNLRNRDDVLSFAAQFGRWLLQVGKNTVKVVGYAVRMKWTPDIAQSNSSNSSTNHSNSAGGRK